MSFTPLIQGFSLGAGLIVAIGAQNAFVLRQGLKRNYVFATALVCSLADALLISLGVAGMGVVIIRFPRITNIVTLGGVIFLFIYGGLAFRNAIFPSSIKTEDMGGRNKGLQATILAALGFSFLNPHVYLDTFILIGSLGAQFQGGDRTIFALGAISASFTWFFGLAFGAVRLAPLFQKPEAWRGLDFFIGIVMLWLAIGLMSGILE